MKNFKTLIILISLLTNSLFFIGCDKKDETPVVDLSGGNGGAGGGQNGGLLSGFNWTSAAPISQTNNQDLDATLATLANAGLVFVTTEQGTTAIFNENGGTVTDGTPNIHHNDNLESALDRDIQNLENIIQQLATVPAKGVSVEGLPRAAELVKGALEKRLQFLKELSEKKREDSETVKIG